MHERTRIADELDYPHCPNCGEALTLEDARAGETHCPMHRTDTLEDLSPDYPTDDDLARRDAQIDRGYRHLAAWIATGVGVFVGVLVLVAGLALLTRDVQAQDTRHVTRTINGHPYQWTLPEAGCALLRAWEDNSAQAWCPDGLMNYDPDGSDTREAGTWYAVDTTR